MAKKRLEKQKYPRYLLLVVILIMAYLVFLTIKPFLAALVGAGILAYIFYPVYKFLLKYIKSKGLTALVVSLIIVILIAVPTGLIVLNISKEAYTSLTAQNISKEAYYTYTTAKQRMAKGETLSECKNNGELLCKLTGYINKFLASPETQLIITPTLGKVIIFITEKASEILFSIPKVILNLIIVLFTTVYLFIDGKNLFMRLKKVVPLRLHHQKQFYNQFGEVMHAILYGTVIIALVEGALGTFGFYIFGISGAVFWGIVMAILALLPVVGASIIWIPASLILIISGSLQSNPAMILSGLGLFIYCGVLIGGTELILRPRIVGKKARIHPLLILIGVLGGIAVFGIIGFVIGPLILAFVKTAFEIYEKERLAHNKE